MSSTKQSIIDYLDYTLVYEPTTDSYEVWLHGKLIVSGVTRELAEHLADEDFSKRMKREEQITMTPWDSDDVATDFIISQYEVNGDVIKGDHYVGSYHERTFAYSAKEATENVTCHMKDKYGSFAILRNVQVSKV